MQNAKSSESSWPKISQKCTETLLNTWHTWKFHDRDRLHRAKVDRQNLHRMQAIAHWMQHQMGAIRADQQAVVSYEALHKRLREHIEGEKPPHPEVEAEDIATAFLEFVQDRAGLLVEIGDRMFSFVHLTFQEYLTAAHIQRICEPRGVEYAWENEIREHCEDPRWSEVLRLLVASYRSDESQEILLDRMLERCDANATCARLVGGLLLDAIPAAEERMQKILEALLEAACGSEERSDLKKTLAMLRSCIKKADPSLEETQKALKSLAPGGGDEGTRSRLRIVSLTAGLSLEETWSCCNRGSEIEEALLALLIDRKPGAKVFSVLEKELERLKVMSDVLLLSSLHGAFQASTLMSLQWGRRSEDCGRDAFFLLLTALAGGRVFFGPSINLLSFLLLSAPDVPYIEFGLALDLDRAGDRARDRDRALDLALARDRALDRALDRAGDRDRARALDRALALALDRALARALNRARALARALARARDRDRDRARALDLDLDLARARALDLARARARALNRALARARDRSIDAGEIPEVAEVWKTFTSDPEIMDPLLKNICRPLGIPPSPQWFECLTSVFIPNIPSRNRLLDPSFWEETIARLESGESPVPLYSAAALLLLDGLLYVVGWHRPAEKLLAKIDFPMHRLEALYLASDKSQATFARLAKLTRDMDAPPLRIAHCIRDLAYGDESRTDDLRGMVENGDPAYSEIFVRCYWR